MFKRAEMLHPEERAQRDALRAIDFKARTPEQQRELDRVSDIIHSTALRLESEAPAEHERPKVVMLSATPFAYHFSLDYAEGFLFDHGPEPDSRAYNTPSARDRFFVENFGYRMRTGKLTQPENATATGILERRFAEKLMKAATVLAEAHGLLMEKAEGAGEQRQAA